MATSTSSSSYSPPTLTSAIRGPTLWSNFPAPPSGTPRRKISEYTENQATEKVLTLLMKTRHVVDQKEEKIAASVKNPEVMSALYAIFITHAKGKDISVLLLRRKRTAEHSLRGPVKSPCVQLLNGHGG